MEQKIKKQESKTLYTDQQRENAIGDTSKMTTCDKNSLELLKKLMKPMDKPKSGEWLDSHKESGQTFQEYLNKKRNYKKMQSEVIDTKKFIYIVALEDDIDEDFQEKLRIFAQAFFKNIRVKFYDFKRTQKGQLMEKWKIPSRINDDVKQYNASNILEKLKLIRPQDAYCIIGVIMSDIYPRPSWNYVFGLASLSEKVGVFSFARYNDQFWNPELKPNRDKIIYRSCKVMVHEICHQFGIKHCVYYYCIMNGSNHMEEASNKPFLLCPVCVRKMQSALQFNLRDRYEDIKQASQQIGGKYFLKHVDFVDQILQALPKIENQELLQQQNKQQQQQKQNLNNYQKLQNKQINLQKQVRKVPNLQSNNIKNNNNNVKNYIHQLNQLNLTNEEQNQILEK